LRLHISSIAYGYKDLYVANFGESSACNVNVICAPQGTGWENERNSVALILDGNSEALCSGALINNTCNLNIPYLLTANHCFDFNSNVAQWKFTFQAWSSTCTPSQNANGVTFNGSTLRARNAGSDFCLVELNQLPPANSGITLSGWSRANVASTSGVSITHPRGDVMKIATYNTTITQEVVLGSSDWRVTWASGTVEPGSSGGPLYNNNHQIIGQVHAGDTTVICEANDHAFFGRFDISWTGGGTNDTRLSNWLDPNNTGAMNTDSRGIGIIGSEPVCTTTNYTFVGPPVTWSSSNPNGLSINSTTGAATRVNNFNGQVTITATMNGACGTTNFTRNVWVGKPGASISTLIYPLGQRGVNPVTLNPGATYIFYCDPVSGFPTSWTWILPSGFSFYGGSTTSSPYITTSSTNGNYTMYCRVNNACGFSYTNSLGITIESGGGGNPLRVRSDSEENSTDEVNSAETQIYNVPYPNPTTETVNCLVLK
jgi:lysyl endopeptidase